MATTSPRRNRLIASLAVALLALTMSSHARAQSAIVVNDAKEVPAAAAEETPAEVAPDIDRGRRAATATGELPPPPKPEPKKDPLLSDDWTAKLKWRSIGPANMSGRITALAVYEADPTVWWAATASGGLLKTTNNGRTFTHQFDKENTSGVGDVAVAPSNKDIVWVGTGESNPRNSVSWGDGVYKSTDGGKTWKNMGLKETYQIGRIAIHPENPDVVYVGALGRLWGTNEERGLYKTTDGGETWEKILYIDEKTGVVDVNMHPTDPDTLLVATYERQRDGFDGNDPMKRFGPGAGIYKTTDGGKTFKVLTEGLPTCDLGRVDIDYYRKDPNIVYAIVESEKIGKQPEDAPYVGITGESADVGARLTDVIKDGPADKAGLKKGDIVIRVDGETVQSYNDMLAKVRRHLAGATVDVEVSRERESMTFELALEKYPEPDADEDEEDAPRRGRGNRGRRSPFSGMLGGQRENMQDQQGPDGHDYGGIYRSEDGGESWTRVNSLNARPMYFSQIRVDPSDDQRIYTAGISLYKSDDGGETFSGDGHGRDVHVDHHALWIDPDDGRHMILGNDGGLYITYDRMKSWDHHNHFAIGQFYHVAVGPRRDYMVYGGLQDNGSWGGPNRTRDGRGPINEDWISIGGGDGFVCRVDPNDPDLIYYESQNGGLGRRNIRTGDMGFLRPRAPRGTRYRFNWKTPFILSQHNAGIYYTAGNHVFRSWFQGEELEAISPEITNTDKGAASALAESPRDASLLYVGTTDGALWRTEDGGKSWTDIFDFVAPKKEDDGEAVVVAADDPVTGTWTGETVSEFTPEGSEFSLDLKLGEEGKVTGSLESRMGGGPISDAKFDATSKKLTFAYIDDPMDADFEGTIEDGKVVGKLSMGGGRFSMDISATRGSGEAEAEADVETSTLASLLDQPMWISTLDASHHDDERVYLAVDGHRSDDDRPFAFVSNDRGQTWASLTANLPDGVGSARVLREDIENEDVLYLGCEFKSFVSVDRGETWTSLNSSNLPTVAVHEFAQHPTAGEIVAGTHGRSLWVLDVTPLRQMGAETLAEDAYLYAPNDVVYWQSEPRRGGTNRRFVGDNPSSSARIFYHLNKPARRLSLEVVDRRGDTLAELDVTNEKGLHIASWNMRGSGNRRSRVEPGVYDVVMTVDNTTLRQSLRIDADPDRPGAILWGERYDEILEIERMLNGGDDEEGAGDDDEQRVD